MNSTEVTADQLKHVSGLLRHLGRDQLQELIDYGTLWELLAAVQLDILQPSDGILSGLLDQLNRVTRVEVNHHETEACLWGFGGHYTLHAGFGPKRFPLPCEQYSESRWCHLVCLRAPATEPEAVRRLEKLKLQCGSIRYLLRMMKCDSWVFQKHPVVALGARVIVRDIVHVAEVGPGLDDNKVVARLVPLTLPSGEFRRFPWNTRFLGTTETAPS